jgi:ribose transport system substrate-binding protein
MNKKWALLSVLLAGVLVLAACAPQATATPTAAAGAATGGKYTLGLVVSTLNNPFFVSLRDGAQKAADSAGATLVVVDAQDDSAKMTSGIEDLISRGVNALIVNPTDSDAVVPAIQKANAAKIPVLTVDRAANGGTVVSHIASDNVAGGQMAAEYLCKAINGKGNVVELQGVAGTSAARDRGQGFEGYMSKSCTGAKIVSQQTANFNRDEGLSVFENILQSQPDIAGVFAQNDEMVLGAIQAADAAGRKGIVFVGFDAISDAIQAIKDGKLGATIAQQPTEMGKLAVETAIKHLNGQSVDANIPVPLTLVTSDNVAQFQ